MLKRKGFTLIELLVVIAIIAILAAILFPVFAQAKAAAKKIACLSNFNQMTKAMMMYQSDYDDGFPHSNTGSNGGPGWGYGRPDYVWPELVKPYVKNWLVHRCPTDPNATDTGLSRDPNEIPVPTNHPQIEYYWGERTDLGMNYDFLSPWIVDVSTSPTYVGSLPQNAARVTTSAQTVLFVDSIWYRNTQSGLPEGAGNWVVEAPCVRDAAGNFLDPMNALRAPNTQRWQNYGVGWYTNPSNTPPYSWLEYGGAWPRHSGGKNVNTAFVDGHCKSMTISGLAAGCDVRRFFAGGAYDPDRYLWDLR
jgi:prepilin-type N-terminal cleavage/methylation domain-containing protein/prepilin-type processing-associated H-X9-DG protein